MWPVDFVDARPSRRAVATAIPGIQVGNPWHGGCHPCSLTSSCAGSPRTQRRSDMRTLVAISTALAFLLLPLASGAAAQGMKWRGSGGWGPGSAYGRLYDPKTVETVTGEVVKVDRIVPLRGMSGGVHLVVKTDKGDVSVHLGPQWYLENQDVKIEPKDRVEITGSRVSVQGQAALIAARVRKGDQVLELRDAAGVPMWAGWRRG
jgi:hypothetical protein